jgi:hypothetical protein
MATSPSNATTQEYTQGVNEIGQNDLNPPTFQTDTNPEPPMAFADSRLSGLLDEYYNKGDENVAVLVRLLITQVRLEYEEVNGDALSHHENVFLFTEMFLNDLVMDTLDALLENVNFNTGRIKHNNEPITTMHARNTCARVVNEFLTHLHHAPTIKTNRIINEFGFDTAMNEYGAMFKPDDDVGWLGLTAFLVGQIAYNFLFPIVIKIITLLVNKKFDTTQAPTSVGECALCCDESSVLLTLPCGHAFGENCLQDWVDTKERNEEPTTCPMCRAPF